jgi:hypothetical protein
VKKGVWSRYTAISDQKQFNKIIIVSICCHDAENRLKDKGCNGGCLEESFCVGLMLCPLRFEYNEADNLPVDLALDHVKIYGGIMSSWILPVLLKT